MIRINKIFKTFFMVFVLVFLLSGCSSEANTDDDKDPIDEKNPNGQVDYEDPGDDTNPPTGAGEAPDLFVSVMLNELYNGDGHAYTLTIDAAGFYSIKSIGDLDLEGSLSTLEGAYVS